MRGDTAPPASDDARQLLWSEATWTELDAVDRSRLVAILPVGAVEAHGPHLPLSTDVVIAEAMALAGAGELVRRGRAAAVLPAIAYTAADFARGFVGTISLRPETVTAVVIDIARALADAGLRWLVVANAHLDPGHLASLHAAARQLAEDELRVIFPDLTRKPWALRLGEEFKSGACHAGRYEGSIVMARRPDLVRESIQRTLPANPSSLSTAIRRGAGSFEEAGGDAAYFGAPAQATAAEGEDTVRTLGQIIADAVAVADHPDADHPDADQED